MSLSNLQIEDTSVETETTVIYKVKTSFTFTEEDLKDATPITMTKRQLFDFLKTKEKKVAVEPQVSGVNNQIRV